jgi:hypothetical protein
MLEHSAISTSSSRDSVKTYRRMYCIEEVSLIANPDSANVVQPSIERTMRLAINLVTRIERKEVSPLVLAHEDTDRADMTY